MLNLPIYLGISDESDKVITQLLKDEPDLKASLDQLSRYFKVQIKFSEPVKIKVPDRWIKIDEHTRRRQSHKITDSHVFSKFIKEGSGLYYLVKRNGQYGYPARWLDKIISIKLISTNKKDEFSSFDKFKKKFDNLFITDNEIRNLWNHKSAQHGGRYSPSDFHKIGKRGKETLNRFLVQFKGVPGSEGTPGYCTNDFGTSLSKRYYSYHHRGRDITIHHSLGRNYVTYSSEYHGCANGRYGLIANKNEFLWLEDD